MIFSPDAKARLDICEACKHFRKTTRTCGTAIKGNKVGSKRLCGCFMDIKTTLKFATCPMSKWGALEMSKDDYLEIKELLSLTKDKISSEQQQAVRHYLEKYAGMRVKQSSCTPCVLNYLHKLKEIKVQYESNQGSSQG